MQNSSDHIRQLLDELYRKESRGVFATLIRLLGDFDLAEDALHDAFKAADWAQIAELYTLLLRAHPSPVIELNRAVAIATHSGPEAGLQQIDAILGRRDLKDYHLAYAARTELCRKTGRRSEARTSWERALTLAQQEPERRFIEGKLRELDK